MGKAGLKIAALVLGAPLVACSTQNGPDMANRDGGMRPVSITTASLHVPLPFALISNDTCNASPLGWLIGRSRADIPIPTDLSHRRVTCTHCPVSQDVRPDRLNILYDERTGTVMKLSCG